MNELRVTANCCVISTTGKVSAEQETTCAFAITGNGECGRSSGMRAEHPPRRGGGGGDAVYIQQTPTSLEDSDGSRRRSVVAR